MNFQINQSVLFLDENKKGAWSQIIRKFVSIIFVSMPVQFSIFTLHYIRHQIPYYIDIDNDDNNDGNDDYSDVSKVGLSTPSSIG